MTAGKISRAASVWALSFVAAGGLGCSSQKPAATPVSPPQAPAFDRRSDAAKREHVSVTVYNSNFALVKERRSIQLGSGRVALAFEDVSAHIQPETVHIRGLDAPGELTVLEQNYRYDLLSPEKLLEKYVGRRLKVARYNQKLGSDEIKDAELLSAQNGPVLRIDGEIVSGGFDRFIFPELPESLLAKPTLVWLLDSARAEQRVEVSYLTQNLSWRADYVLVLSADDAKGDLSGWVTLDNQSGTSFDGAELRLVAGDVQRLAPAPAPPPMDMVQEEAQAADGAGQAFRQEALFEYHLYALQRPTDLRDKEQKQVSLLEAPGIKLQKKLVFRGLDYALRGRFGETLKNTKASVFVVVENAESHGLGMPLPQGIVRVYKADQAGALQFVGEDQIEHTPRDEKVEVRLGEAFDVVADRRQMDYRAFGRCTGESEWQIDLRNHKDVAERIEVIEPVGGDWKVVRSSHPGEKRDNSELVFSVDVPARGSVKLEYRVRVSWC